MASAPESGNLKPRVKSAVVAAVIGAVLIVLAVQVFDNEILQWIVVAAILILIVVEAFVLNRKKS